MLRQLQVSVCISVHVCASVFTVVNHIANKGFWEKMIHFTNVNTSTLVLEKEEPICVCACVHVNVYVYDYVYVYECM